MPVLDKTIEAKGGVVPDEFYRTGQRWRRVDDKGTRASAHGKKPSVRQRKATLVSKPSHPLLAAAYASLMDPAFARAGFKGGGDAGVRCGSAEAKAMFLFSWQPAWKGAQANSDINKTAEVRWIHRAGASYGCTGHVRCPIPLFSRLPVLTLAA